MFPFEELVLVLTDGFAKKNIDIIRIYPRRVCFSPSAWSLSHVQLFAIQWTLAHQARLSVGFSRQENWGGLPFPSPGDLPDPGIELVSPVSPTLQANSLPAEPSEHL